ncbi:unnamed protein product, partial [Iphiclides podalirius]
MRSSRWGRLREEVSESLFIFAEVSRACNTITQKFHDVTARAEMSCHFITESIRDTVHDWEYDQLRHLAHDFIGARS